jgi:hypothetical protein
MSCKEDSILLPAYTLALEVTILQFRAADVRQSQLLRRGYAFATLAGAVVYLLWVVPHYWSSDGYGGERNFSTRERLLTQPRVLCLYLWQILAPLPSHMPFYYDWVQPSRSFLHPWTTLPAIVVVGALLGTAWRLRLRWPLFSLGVLLYFGAHFITSNVVGLELAFEHRNNFALSGAVLAVGTLLAHLCKRLRLPQWAQVTGGVVLLATLATATTSRAYDWRSNLTLAHTSTESAPGSGLAWISLCAAYFKAGGSSITGNPKLDQAIAACEVGENSAPSTLNITALLIVLKSLRGDIAAEDWNRFHSRLQTVTMTRDNRRAIQVLIYHSRAGVKVDKQEILKAIHTQTRRVMTSPFELTSYGYYIMIDMGEPELAMPYFMTAIQGIPLKDPFPGQLAQELRDKERPDLAAKIESAGRARAEAVGAATRAR